MDKNDFRVLIKHCYLMGKNTVQAQQWLAKCYPDSAPSKTTICKWYADFKRGRTNTNDAKRSGRPSEAVNPENVKQVLKIVMDDRKVKVREIAEMVNISTGSAWTILQEKLGMKKACESISTKNRKVDNPNEDETKHRQTPEDVGEISAKDSNEMRSINVFDDIKNDEAQEENTIKEEVVPKILDDEMKYEFVGVVVKEEPEDNYDTINVKSELYNDVLSNGTDNNEESTSKINPESTEKQSHTGESPYKCDICDRTFSYCSNFVRHKRCHTGEKPFKCDACDKAFSIKFHLTEHKRCHTGEKPYKCDMCDKTFSCSSSLVQHKRRHTGEKPFKCDKCNKTFPKKYSLLAHYRVHTGEKPFKCDVCHKTFTMKYSLMRHKDSHIG